MSKYGRIFALSGALLASSLAHATPPASGNQWADECKSKNKVHVDFCHIFARGLADGLRLWMLTAPDTARACIPQEVRADQLVEVAMNYLAKNPKSRHENAGLLLALSFIDAWPCGELKE